MHQAIAEISDAVGLGMELYVNKRKITMLEDPSAYLMQRNKALMKVGSEMQTAYTNVMGEVVKAITGKTDKSDPEYIAAAGQPWVKALVQEITSKLGSMQVRIIDVQYPILGSAYKAQKSKNARELEAKKEFIKEGA